jgi:hypothetical protein
MLRALANLPSVRVPVLGIRRLTGFPHPRRRNDQSLDFPGVGNGITRLHALEFDGTRCVAIASLPSASAVRGRHPVMLEGDYAAWKEMIESIRAHGGADLTHTLNYLTLPDWPLRLVAVDEAEGQLDVDRFYRYQESLQSFFDEAAAVETRFAA